MGTADSEGLISNGYERLLNANKEKIDEIERRIREGYAEAMASVGVVGRMRIEETIRRELKAEIDKIVPPAAFY